LLSLRLQRNGRKKLAHYRLIAQEHSLSPTSGRVADYLGTFDPYKKEFAFDKEKVETHLKNGAQPTNRVAKLLKAEGVKLPSWVKIHENAKRPPKKAVEEEKSAAPAADTAASDDAAAEEATAEVPTEAQEQDVPATEQVADATEEAAAETPAETEESAAEEQSAEQTPADEAKPAE